MIKLKRGLRLLMIACPLLLSVCQAGCQSVQHRSAKHVKAQPVAQEHTVTQNASLQTLRRQRREAVEKDVTRKLEQARSLYQGLGDH